MARDPHLTRRGIRLPALMVLGAEEEWLKRLRRRFGPQPSGALHRHMTRRLDNRASATPSRPGRVVVRPPEPIDPADLQGQGLGA